MSDPISICKEHPAQLAHDLTPVGDWIHYGIVNADGKLWIDEQCAWLAAAFAQSTLDSLLASAPDAGWRIVPLLGVTVAGA